MGTVINWPKPVAVVDESKASQAVKLVGRMPNGGTIHRVKRTRLFDVFVGNGWRNHTRVELVDGHIKFVAGQHLPRIKFIEIAKTIEEMMK